MVWKTPTPSTLPTASLQFAPSPCLSKLRPVSLSVFTREMSIKMSALRKN